MASWDLVGKIRAYPFVKKQAQQRQKALLGLSTIIDEFLNCQMGIRLRLYVWECLNLLSKFWIPDQLEGNPFT
jgi:hypothetical protein